MPPTCEGGGTPGAGSEGDRPGAPRGGHVWAAHKERGGRALPSAPRPEREPFLPAQRKWRRRSRAPGAHAGVRPGAGRSALPPASGAAGLQAAVSPPPSPRPPGGHPLTCSRTRRALRLRQVPKQVHGGGGVGRRAAREQRRAPHPAAAGSTPGGGVSDGMAGPRRRQSTEGGSRTPPIGARRGPAAPEFCARERWGREGAGRRGAHARRLPLGEPEELRLRLPCVW